MHRAYTHKTQFTRNFPKVGKKNLSLIKFLSPKINTLFENKFLADFAIAQD